MQHKALVRLVLCTGVLMAAILALTACSSGSAQKEKANKPRPLPEAGQSLRPGEYRSVDFEPSFSFSVDKDWSSLDVHASDALALSSEAETRWLGFTNVQKVYKPPAKGNLSGEPNVVKAPKDLLGWFQHHPYLNASRPQPITVGGVKGEQFDLVVEAPEGYYGACGSDCVDIYSLSGGEPVGFEDGIKTRIIVYEDINGETVANDIGVSKASEFDEFMIEAKKVLDTVKWGGS
jgi:hypothetical protein